MNTSNFFENFLIDVMDTPHWRVMENTVEDSPWHREANVAVHTLMTLDAYVRKFKSKRTERQQNITMLALLFHDFGKPEAEETLEKKEEPGVFYRRYAGHEPISGNEFMSFICDNDELRGRIFAQGLGWNDLRSIKFMIEHHLPYGLKNPQKRADLRQTIAQTLGEDEVCFWDMLRSDAAGRISDDHETKLENVETWINEFEPTTWKPRDFEGKPIMIVLVGVSGAGKSTFIKSLMHNDDEAIVVCEDDYRLEYAEQHMNGVDLKARDEMTEAEWYDAAWKFCHMNPESKFDAFSKAKFEAAIATGKTVVLDRMNQGKKGRGKYIQAAKQKGYKIQSVEFMISESKAKERQRTRGDKRLPDYRVHQIVMQLETPWYGPEVDYFVVVPA